MNMRSERHASTCVTVSWAEVASAATVLPSRGTRLAKPRAITRSFSTIRIRAGIMLVLEAVAGEPRGIFQSSVDHYIHITVARSEQL